MKKAFLLCLIFVILFSILTIGAGFFSMLSQVTMHMDAGQKTGFFNKAYFLEGMIAFMPWCAVFSTVMTVLYVIKHRFSVLQLIIPYFLMVLLVWLVLIPGFMHLYIHCCPEIDSPSTDNLSGGYFRVEGDYLTYSTKDSTDSESLWRRKLYRISTDDMSAGYSDSLIAETVRIPFWCSFVSQKGKILRDAALSRLSQGYGWYLVFATIGLSLSAMIFLHRIHTWRLLNAMIVLAHFVIIEYVNTLFYDTQITSRIAFLGTWWLPIAFNCTVFVFLMTVGIIDWKRNSDRNREVR